MLSDYIIKIRYKSRLVKFNQVTNFLKPSPTDKFLEVGVASKEYSPVDNFLIKNYPYREKITALGVGDLSKFESNFPDVNVVGNDGKKLPLYRQMF